MNPVVHRWINFIQKGVYVDSEDQSMYWYYNQKKGSVAVRAI